VNVTLNTQLLAAELRLLCKIVPQKPMMPVLAYVLLKAEGGDVVLEATDLELAMRTTCPVVGLSELGQVTLPAFKMLQLVEQMPDGSVTIEGHDKTFVSSGTFKSRVQSYPSEDFPRLPLEPQGGSEVSLQGLIERTRYAISQKPTKYALDGALLSLNAVAAMVSTDAKRLSIATSHYAGEHQQDEVIPSKAMDALALFDGMLTCTQTDKHLFFRSGERLLISRRMEGKFPAYQRIVPKQNDKQIVVSRATLAAALRRAGVVSEVNCATYFATNGQTMTITSSSAEVGDSFEEVPVQYAGDPIKICVNWRYVLDFAEAARGEFVTMSLKDDQTPMLLTDGTDFLNVVMPMRA